MSDKSQTSLRKPQVPWIISYLPKSTAGIIGRETQIAALKAYVDVFPKAKKPAILLCGPAGSGKTSCVHALAHDYNYELFEVNASDVRNKDSLREILAPATQQKSFFYEGKVVLIDEVDGISGNADRGGMQELATILEQSKVPIILTANEIDPQKFKPILKLCTTIDMDRLQPSVISKLLERIIETEGIEQSELLSKTIRKISTYCDGDARAAINDLQLLIVQGKLAVERLDLLTQRDRKHTIEEALRTVFKTMDPKLSYETLQNLTENFDEQMLWIEYNVAKEYDDVADIARAYGALTKADVFRARIRKNQEWRLIIYAQILASGGVSIAKKKPYVKNIEYAQTTRLLRIWQVNMSNAKRKQIALKIAQKTHCSIRRAFEDVAHVRMQISSKQLDSASKSKIISDLELDEDEVAWLKK
jgi:replication factor C large subunit